MQRRSFLGMMGVGAATVIGRTVFAAEKTYTIALVPGLTTDPFYVMMRRGADAAAQAVGAELLFQGAAEWDAGRQALELDAVIAAKPDAILIAPTDKVRLIAPLKRANDAGIPVITVDTFIGDGAYQTGDGAADFPLSYVASDNIAGGAFAARALAKSIGDKGRVYVATVKPGVSVTEQREEGFRREMKSHPNIEVLDTQFNDDDADKAAGQVQAVLRRVPDLAGVFGADLFSAYGMV